MTERKLSTTTTTTSNTEIVSSKPGPLKARTKAEIARLVKKRVQERDQWLVDGLPQGKASHVKDFGQFLGDVFPKYLQHKPPTQAYLDEHFPVQYITNWQHLCNPPANQIQMTWMGHASVLIQVNGCTILTDPVFSQRCAPVQMSGGPKRVRAPPCTIAELCHHLLVDVVLISHNHYDHLDTSTVREIHKCSPATTFVVPLGLKSWCHRIISKQAIVHELDWNEHYDYHYSPASTTSTSGTTRSSTEDVSSDSIKFGQQGRQIIRIICVPMRHWGSRFGVDRDRTLWCGFSLATQPADDDDCGKDNNTLQSSCTKKILFPGDTAWFDSMEDLVGKPYGPYDVAAIPIGAYEPREYMKRNHINVPEAVKMKDALRAKNAVPIHWGTFPLTVEPILEPQQVLQDIMKERPDAKSFESWLIGETKIF